MPMPVVVSKAFSITGDTFLGTWGSFCCSSLDLYCGFAIGDVTVECGDAAVWWSETTMDLVKSELVDTGGREVWSSCF